MMDILKESSFYLYAALFFFHPFIASNCYANDYLDAKSYYKRGVYHEKEGKLTEALTYYNQALNVNPKFVKAYRSRGSLWAKLGNYDRAMADFESVLEIIPEDATAYFNLGVALYKKGDNASAVDRFTRAIEIRPNYGSAFRNRGTAFKENGDIAHAIFDFTKALEINPNDEIAANNLAWILSTWPDEKYRNGTKALSLAKDLVNRNPNARNLDTLAVSYAEAGDFSKAFEIQKRVIHLVEELGDKRLLNECKQRLEYYKSQRAWRAPK